MGKLLSKITSGKSIASVAVAASAAIFVTAAVIIGIVFALIPAALVGWLITLVR